MATLKTLSSLQSKDLKASTVSHNKHNWLIVILVLFALQSWGQLIPFNENFSYPAGNLVGQGGTTVWTLQGTDNTNPIQVTSPGLFYPQYQASGIGLATTLANNTSGQDLFRNFTGTNTINSGSVYISALVKVTAATRAGDYFLSFKETPNAGLSVFKGRLYAKDSLGTGNLVFGVTKSASSGSAPVSWTPQYYTFGTTYLVVLKYTFIAGTLNDIVDVYVFDPANSFPVTEPATSNASASDAGSDGVGQRCVQLRQGALNSPTVTVDGIRVGQSWADAVTQDIAAPVATFNPPSGAINVLIDVIPTITFNEPVKKTDGTDLTNADLASLVTFNKTNSSGAPVAFTATIDATKTVITVTPSALLDNNQVYYLAVGAVEDGGGNESSTQSATFTTIPGTLSNDATLSDLKVDGTTVAGFSPSIYDYSVILPYGLPAVPAVTATTTFPLATTLITPAASIPGTTTVLVTAQDGVTQLTYTVSFMYGPPSTNSALTYIKWLPNGLDPTKQTIRVMGFTSTTFNYTVEVPAETNSLFVDAEPDFTIPASGCPPATYVVTQPVNLTGTVAERTATVVCTAQDGITTSTYTVLFSKAPSTNYYLFKHSFDNMPADGWAYSANVGTSTNQLGFYGTTAMAPKYKWVTPDDGGTITTSANNGAENLEFFVKVLDKDPASNLHFYVEKSYDSINWVVISTDPMPLNVSITQWHQVVIPVNDNTPGLYFRFRATASTGNNTTGLFYLDDVSLTQNSFSDATLSDLKVDGTTISGFSSEIFNYNVVLPAGAVVVPTVTAFTSQPAASAVITAASGIPGTTSILVTAPNGTTTATYAVNFSDSLAAPSNLTAVAVSSSQVDLNWTDNETDEDGYRIQRKPNNGLFSEIATVGADVTTFSDLPPGLDPDDFIPADRFSNVTLTSGVKFADVTDYKGVPLSLLLDVYEPTGDNTPGRPVIIWIHGGGFRYGTDRTQGYIVNYCNRMAKRGYVCMSIDYRLRNGVDMPDQASEFPALQDAARDANAAISWVKANAALYHIDPNLIFIAGGSAGGRTAQTVCQFDGPDPTALYPPENLYLTTPWNKTGIVANATLWGGLEPEMRGWVYPWLQPTDIPTILVHGSADVTILPQNSIDLNDTLTSTGVPSELHIIPGATHSCLGYETQISAWIATFFAQQWSSKNAAVTSYTYRTCAYNAAGNSPFSNEATASFFKTLNVKVLLEGLYDNAGGLNQAYDDLGPHFAPGIADQVTVELHNALNYGTIEYTSGLVNLSTGGIVSISTIPAGLSGSYYITIKHRNSIETVSAAPVSFTGGTINYDFSTSASQAFGDNTNNWHGLGVFLIWGGDVNQDGIVDTGDMNFVENESTAVTMGYVPEDVNGDGIVDTGDMNTVENNSTAVIQVITP